MGMGGMGTEIVLPAHL